MVLNEPNRTEAKLNETAGVRPHSISFHFIPSHPNSFEFTVLYCHSLISEHCISLRSRCPIPCCYVLRHLGFTPLLHECVRFWNARVIYCNATLQRMALSRVMQLRHSSVHSGRDKI